MKVEKLVVLKALMKAEKMVVLMVDLLGKMSACAVKLRHALPARASRVRRITETWGCKGAFEDGIGGWLQMIKA